MSNDPLTAGIDLAKDFLDKFIPDPAQKAQAELALAKLKQDAIDGEANRLAKQNADQAAIDLEEAKSTSLFDKWRDGAGWVCVLALFYNFLFRPIMTGFFGQFQFPVIDSTQLWPLLSGLLGLGAAHMYQSVQIKK